MEDFPKNIIMIKILINFLKILKKKVLYCMNILEKLLKELMVKKFIIIKLKVFQEYYKIMKINY